MMAMFRVSDGYYVLMKYVTSLLQFSTRAAGLNAVESAGTHDTTQKVVTQKPVAVPYGKGSSWDAFADDYFDSEFKAPFSESEDDDDNDDDDDDEEEEEEEEEEESYCFTRGPTFRATQLQSLEPQFQPSVRHILRTAGEVIGAYCMYGTPYN